MTDKRTTKRRGSREKPLADTFIGVRVRPREVLEVVFHRYPEKSVLLLFYRCDLLKGEPRPIECDEVRWVALEDLPSLDWAPADVPFVRRLAELAW